MKNIKKTRKTKVEKRRLAFEKRNVKKEMNLARYGAEGGSALVKAKMGVFNCRFIAISVALIIAFLCLTININYVTEAAATDSNILFLNEAAVDDDGFKMKTITNNNNGMFLSKGLRNNGDGSYDLKLEAYSTGNTEKVPTDFVLVLDQSGSMSTVDMPKGSYTLNDQDSWSISDIANSSTAYYYKDKDGQFYRVYANRGYMYNQVNASSDYYLDDMFNKFRHFNYGADEPSYASNGYYYFDGNEYRLIYLRVKGTMIGGDGNAWFAYNCWLFYHDDDGNEIQIPNSCPENHPGGQYVYRQVFYIRTLHNCVYDHPLYKRTTGYNELCYKDSDGVVHSLTGQAEFCNSNGMPVTSSGGNIEVKYNGPLYTSDDDQSRLEALNTAAKSFVDQVAEQKNPDGTSVDHKIAIVGFASENGGNYYYNNHELLTPSSSVSANNSNFYGAAYSANGALNLNTNGSKITGWDGPLYGSNSIDGAYENALVTASTPEGKASLEKSVNYITAYGGTQPQVGLKMAYNVLNARTDSEKHYEKQDGSIGNRNTVVIFFTDGRPGNYIYSNQYEVANEVVNEASNLKALGAKVYSIGVFGESDGNPLTYMKYTLESGNSDYTEEATGIVYTSYTKIRENNDETYDAIKAMYINEPETVVSNEKTHRGGLFNLTTYYDLYVLSRVWRNKTFGYTESATDTISDYMRTVSSEYPNATKFVEEYDYGGSETTNYDSYSDMVDGLRGQKVSDKFYFLATNSSALTKAFSDIFISESSATVNYTANNSFFRDTISSSFDTTNASIDISAVAATFDANGEVNGWIPTTITNVSPNWQKGEKTIDIEGFDFTKYYVSKDNLDTANNNLSKKLIVIVSGLTISDSGNGPYFSNTNESGIYRKANSMIDHEGLPFPAEDINENPFENPKTDRFQYTLNISGANANPDITMKWQVVDLLGNEIQELPEELKIYSGTESASSWSGKTPTGYSTVAIDGGIITWQVRAANGITKLMVEDLPENYKLKAIAINNDVSNNYSYTIDLNGQEKQFCTNDSTQNAFLLDRSNQTINISSVAQNRNVTIHLDADASPYVDSNYVFKAIVSWEREDGQSGSETLSMRYNNVQIEAQTVSVPYGANVTVSHEDYFYDTQISKEGFYQGTSEPVTIEIISADGDIYITDKARSNIGEGIPEETKPTRILLYSLAGLAMVSGGAGAAYAYRKKDEFLEQ